MMFRKEIYLILLAGQCLCKCIHFYDLLSSKCKPRLDFLVQLSLIGQIHSSVEKRAGCGHNKLVCR